MAGVVHSSTAVGIDSGDDLISKDEWNAAHTIDYGEDADISTAAFDDVPDAGVLDEIARADHVHGMPSAPTGGGGDLVLLDEVILGSAAADITLTGLDGTHRDLVIVCVGRSASGSSKATSLQFGDGSIDTGSNYLYLRNYYGTIASGQDSATGNTSLLVGAIPGSGTGAGGFAGLRVEILDYASTRWKSIIYQGMSTGDDGTFTVVGNGTWVNATGPLDQIKWFPSSGDFEVGSRVTVYGRG